MGEKGSLKLHRPWRSWLLRILSVYNRRLLFSAGIKWSLKLHPPLRLSLQVLSPNSYRVLPSSSFFARVKWSLKLHFHLRSYLLQILSVYYRRLLFFCWGKMLSKTAPCFALVVTGTFSKFLVCITVVFLFCWGEMVYKTVLSFALGPFPNSQLVTSSSPFFCWGKMLSKTTTSFALVITGIFSEFVACITIVFLFC